LAPAERAIWSLTVPLGLAVNVDTSYAPLSNAHFSFTRPLCSQLHIRAAFRQDIVAEYCMSDGVTEYPEAASEFN